MNRTRNWEQKLALFMRSDPCTASVHQKMIDFPDFTKKWSIDVSTYRRIDVSTYTVGMLQRIRILSNSKNFSHEFCPPSDKICLKSSFVSIMMLEARAPAGYFASSLCFSWCCLISCAMCKNGRKDGREGRQASAPVWFACLNCEKLWLSYLTGWWNPENRSFFGESSRRGDGERG